VQLLAGRASRETLALVACVLGSGIALLDTTAVNVALPTIEQDLGGGLAGQQWVVNAYLLTLGSLLLVGGSLSDVYGERVVFAVGVAAFGVTSVLCALAPTIEALIVARALQGVAGALLVPSALAVIVQVFPDERRAAAVGRWAAWSGVAAVIGPLVGGWLVDVASWRLVFAINVPFVVVAVALGLASVPSRARDAAVRRVDVVGGVLCALGLAGPVFALIEQPSRGWDDPLVVASLVGGLLLLGAFVAWERRALDAMLPLGLFRRRAFSVGNVYTFAMYANLGLLIFFLTLYLQGVAGYSALQSGLATAPMSAIMLLLSSRVGAAAARGGLRWFLAGGSLFFVAGAAWMLRLPADPHYVVDVLPIPILCGLGLASVVAPLTTYVVVGVESAYAGVASGVNNAVARVSGMLAIAVAGVLVASVYTSTLDAQEPVATPAAASAVAAARDAPFAAPDLDGLPAEDAGEVRAAFDAASADALDAAALLIGGLALAAAIIAAVGLRPPPGAPDAATAEGAGTTAVA
jgi:EmrB/QacA subfamily drug resistance transporter